MRASLWDSTATFKRCTAEKASFVLLHQFDLILTVLAIMLGFFELNPVMRYLVAMPVLLLIVKLAIPLLITWLAPGRLLLPAIALLCLVACWNIKEMLFYML
jgi:hypothetical protein